MKKGVSLLLVLLLSLTACGRKEEAEEPDRYGGIRYIPAFRTVETDLDEIKGGCVVEDDVYLIGSVTTNEDYNDRAVRLLRVPLEGGEIEELPGCEPPGDDRNVICSTEGLAIAAGEEGTLWLLEGAWRFVYDFPEDFDPFDMSAGTRGEYYISSESKYVLRQLDGDGNELYRQEWPRRELEERLGLDFISEIYLSAGGDVSFCCRPTGEGALVTMDKTGALLGRVTQEDPNQNWQSVVRLGDGRLAVVRGSYQEGGRYCTDLRAVSREGDAWGESWTLPDFTTVYGGDADTLFYYNAGSDLLAWRESAPAEEGEGEGPDENVPLLNWVNTGLDSIGDRAVMEFLPDGRLVVVQGGGLWSGGEPVELAVLTPTGDPPEKTVLTLGTVQLSSSLEKSVRDFNRTNPDYQIEVREYMDYSAREDWQDAVTRLATEVGAGKVPDILNTYGMPLAGWAASGILEDLWPWIDLDRDIGREDLMLRVLEADSIAGKLYEVFDGFTFSTVAGAADVVGDRMAWTAEDMWTALENMPEGRLAMPGSRERILQQMLLTFWDRLVDPENGTCSFDSREFQEILAFCARFPEEGLSYEEQEGMLRDRELMLADRYPGKFWDLQQIRTEFRGAVSFVGFPNPWEDVGSSFSPGGGGLAMTAAGEHKEGAWAFLRTMLLPHEQGGNPFGWRFPINRESFEKMAQVDGNGRYAYSDSSGKTYFYKKPTQAEYDQVMALYGSVDRVYRWDDSLGEIILEIAGAYFAGDKTLDETAALIQNRAQLYINEQK